VTILCLLRQGFVWEYALMSEHTESDPGAGGSRSTQRGGQQWRREDLSTHQLRTIGQRRADAEEKLARHLREARHPAGEHHLAGEMTPDA
jgi:hypothetical protein